MAKTAMSAEKIEEAKDQKSNAKAIFDALQGEWQLSRTLHSYIAIYSSGKLKGSASFKTRLINDDGTREEEYLYSEEGDFIIESSGTMKTRRQYVYRYQQDIDSISVWFVKTDGSGSVDYLFHRLDFQEESRDIEGCRGLARGEKKVSARGHHLCVDDDYTADYDFTFLNHELREWTVNYTVKGPRKDYVATSTYSLQH